MLCSWYQVLQEENQSGQLLKSRKRVRDSGEFYLEELGRTKTNVNIGINSFLNTPAFVYFL